MTVPFVLGLTRLVDLVGATWHVALCKIRILLTNTAISDDTQLNNLSLTIGRDYDQRVYQLFAQR
jgi:hypothetical protein